MKKILKSIYSVLNQPLVLSVVTTVLLLSIVPLDFPKYKAGISMSRRIDFNDVVSLKSVDVDHNGYSDLVGFCNNDIGSFAIFIHWRPDKPSEQWNFRGRYTFDNTTGIITGDYNHSGEEDIFSFSVSSDSVFLNGVLDPKHPRLITNRFISTCGLREGNSDLTVLPAEMEDLNGDGFLEVVFGISSGFSLFPRNLFAYDIHNDSLWSSPRSGFNIRGIVQSDMNGDGKNEFSVSGYTSENIHDKAYPFSDWNIWVMAFDRKLNFLFPPVMVPGSKGAIFPLAENGPADELRVYTRSHLGNRYKGRVMTFNKAGSLLSEKVLEPDPNMVSGVFCFDVRGKKRLLLTRSDGTLQVYDPGFRLLRSRKYDMPLWDHVLINLDEDPEDEILFPGYEQNKIVILQDDLEDAATVDLQLTSYHKKTVYSVQREPGRKPSLFICSGNMEYVISYNINPMHYWKWGLYVGIFLAVYLFTLLIRHLQRVQMNRRTVAEKKISELQLMVVHNQIDPHFTMNALNSVIEAIRREEKEEAAQSLLHFSKMYRSLVVYGDKITRTLSEELDFTSNYLELERFRFHGQFSYRMDIQPEVNLDLQVPKMILQTPVENAVKHGLLKKEEGALLTIRAFTADHHLRLEVEDNGVGRQQAASDGTSGTGKGLKIMKEFLSLYEKIQGIKIHFQVTDLFTASGNSAGTRVEITMPFRVRKPNL